MLYGSGALGGVVNTVTGRLPEQAREDGYALRGEVRGGDVADERTTFSALMAPRVRGSFTSTE